MFRRATFLSVLLPASTAARSQGVGGTISGTVLDPTGASVSGAIVAGWSLASLKRWGPGARLVYP
jgi:hypothetical protein